MSFLNGLGSLASGLGALSKSTAADAPTASAPAAAPAPAAAAAPAAPAAPPAPAAAAAAAPAGGAIPAGVPPALLPLYEKASKQSGIPVAVLVAQGKQESGFNPNAVSPTGAIGIAQILPSTARDPGYGLAPIDPATLKDPAVAIAFQAAYMRARAGAGADFSHPATVDAALRTYNGNSDPNYVASIRAHMGGA
jgi:soluble lytic murein transglycosylase-like protein